MMLAVPSPDVSMDVAIRGSEAGQIVAQHGRVIDARVARSVDKRHRGMLGDHLLEFGDCRICREFCAIPRGEFVEPLRVVIPPGSQFGGGRDVFHPEVYVGSFLGQSTWP